jgi:hypothetical protein
MDSQEAIEAIENDAEGDQDEYIWVQSLLFNWGAAVVPRDNYYFNSVDGGKAWTLMLKAGVRIIPKDVYSGGSQGFVFLFKDDMTPRPFRSEIFGWKVTYISGGVTGHSLNMASPDHTYFCVNVDSVADEIEAVGEDVGIAKLSWADEL